jgi:TetR/AcrR family transcriptional regulator, biofilm operon repressor
MEKTDDPSNRDAIFSTALKLFAEKGYEGVSMRTIAARVGIKASSIYNHFSGKEAIFDEVACVFREKLEGIAKNQPPFDLDEALARYGPREVLRLRLSSTLILLENPELSVPFRVITRGQYHNKSMRELLLSEFFLKPLEGWTSLFEGLIARGHIRPYPPRELAVEFQAFSMSRFYERSLMPDGTPIDAALERRLIERHVDFFWTAVALEGGSDEA